ncbi:hypothetical protein CR513_53948, partial [Mucuna pruriens]
MHRPLIERIIFLGYSLISWKTKKQHIMSQSFIEVMYCLVTNIMCKLKWVKIILLILGITHSMFMQLYYDSQVTLYVVNNLVTLYVVNNLVFHELTKYSKVGCHLVQNKIIHGNL